jgi:hypothetical protein
MSNVLKSKDTELSARLDAARARMQGVKKNEDAELSAKIAELKARFNTR